MQVIWHGTGDEGQALTNAIAHNCNCQFGLMGVRLSMCALHKAMIEDQKWLDALLFERHIAPRLLREEGITKP